MTQMAVAGIDPVGGEARARELEKKVTKGVTEIIYKIYLEAAEG